jgi:tRNA threonylcarbamoyladenosine biosynthesis protein TsaB
MSGSPDSNPSQVPVKPRRILAIDTAMAACSVCVADEGVEDAVAIESVAMETGHAEALMPMIKRVIEAVPGGFDTIDRIAVSIGPGSFTGLRVGISAARGIGLGIGCPVVGISTLSAYGVPLMASDGTGVIAVGIDARHGQLYFQAFTAAGRTIILPRVTSVKEATRLIGSGPALIAGSGAAALAVEAMAMGVRASIADPSPAPSIIWIARLGLVADPAAAPAKPMYLKAPSAQPQAQKAVPRATEPGAPP